jgi:predicted phage baseplate assembly protein
VSGPEPTCGDERRRRKIRVAGPDGRRWNGLDELEVSEDRRTLTVTFLNKAPKVVEPFNVRIDGGQRVTAIKVVDVRLCRVDDPALDDCMQVTVDRPGDASPYTLRLVEPDAYGRPGDRPLAGFDPRYAKLTFSFMANCPTGLDCARDHACPPAALAEPEISYLAKDYTSFRQLILDRLSLIMPAWTERHVPDLGVTVVELLAYVGDHLSYYQDAVATEAYLDTARRRVSVRRHVRLVDYPMHDGCNARAWVCVEVDRTVELAAGDCYFVTALPPGQAPRPAALRHADLRGLPDGAYEVFEPLAGTKLRLHPERNEIHLWTWGDRECCLPAGATRATLVDPAAGEAPGAEPPAGSPRLQPGDVLVFEEVRGPHTGAAVDADPTHRQAVRLTEAVRGRDELYGQAIVDVAWASEDALRFPLCISAVGGPDCALHTISVARGNVMLVDHGRTVTRCGEPAEELAVPWTPPDPPTCPPPAEAGVAERLRQLWRCAGAGEALGAAEVAEVHATVGERAATEAGLLPPPAPGPDGPDPAVARAQAEALGRLLAGGPRGPRRPPFTTALRRSPVTLATWFPSPHQIAGGQAEEVERIAGSTHARVVELLAKARGGTPLSAGEVAELRVLFGDKALHDAHLEPADAATLSPAAADAQARALALLAADEGGLLARKRRRLERLAGRARAGYLLGAAETAELRRSWGARFVRDLEQGNPRYWGPAADATRQDPREALPEVCLYPKPSPAPDAGPPTGHGTAAAAPPTPCRERADAWTVRRDLLASGPRDCHLVAELDDRGVALLRFGDGKRGLAPAPGATLLATYRVGNGAAGNVGAGVIAHLVLCETDPSGITGVRNPMPAEGGVDPEPLHEVRLLAPTFRRRLQRAVTADDYATLAGRVPGLQRAAASLSWTGSWYEARVSVDPLGGVDQARLLVAVREALHRYRRIGHDLAVVPARSVPLAVKLRVCIQPHHQWGHVKAALLDVLGTRDLPGGGRGLFHPDNLTFGEDVRASRLVATAQAVPGVASVELIQLERLGEGDDGELDEGLLPIGPLEIARLDNDPSNPENGVLEIEPEGAR